VQRASARCFLDVSSLNLAVPHGTATFFVFFAAWTRAVGRLRERPARKTIGITIYACIGRSFCVRVAPSAGVMSILGAYEGAAEMESLFW